MAYDPGAIDATLAAVVGDDPALFVELREAFLDSAKLNLSALEHAADASAWREAACRMKGLAGSFGAVRLMALAEELVQAAPGDAALLKQLRRAVGRL